MPLTQNQAHDLLTAAKERERLGHAFLVAGPAGVGKKALAVKVVQMLEQNSNDSESGGVDLFGEASPMMPLDVEANLEDLQSEYVRIVSPKSKSRLIRVDDMRELEDSFYLSAPSGQWKIGVVIDADRMNEAAANAFLKTLEEPPKNCLLLLLTSAPDRLLFTILSRCIRIDLYCPEQGGLTEVQQEISQLIGSVLSEQVHPTLRSLALKSDLDIYLKEYKETLAKQYKAELKGYIDHLKQVVDRSYLKEREDQAKAAESAEYLAMRTASVNALVEWFGDVIRWKVGARPILYIEMIPLFEVFASDLSVQDLLARLDALEDLRFLLTETNVSEALALETCFIQAFG